MEYGDSLEVPAVMSRELLLTAEMARKADRIDRRRLSYRAYAQREAVRLRNLRLLFEGHNA